jgi:hypothetical protein
VGGDDGAKRAGDRGNSHDLSYTVRAVIDRCDVAIRPSRLSYRPDRG